MINLMFCGNDKVIDGMIISLLSIVKYCKKQLNIYVLTMDLSDMNENYKPITIEHANVLEKIIKKENSKSKIHLIDITKSLSKYNTLSGSSFTLSENNLTSMYGV